MANRAALSERFVDLRAAMCEFRRPDHLTGRVVDHGDPARFGTGIKFDPQRFDHCLWSRIFEDEDEREATQDSSLVALEELARTCGSARHERPALLVDYQNT